MDSQRSACISLWNAGIKNKGHHAAFSLTFSLSPGLVSPELCTQVPMPRCLRGGQFSPLITWVPGAPLPAEASVSPGPGLAVLPYFREAGCQGCFCVFLCAGPLSLAVVCSVKISVFLLLGMTCPLVPSIASSAGFSAFFSFSSPGDSRGCAHLSSAFLSCSSKRL